MSWDGIRTTICNLQNYFKDREAKIMEGVSLACSTYYRLYLWWVVLSMGSICGGLYQAWVVPVEDCT
jgi:hypothetical protein